MLHHSNCKSSHKPNRRCFSEKFLQKTKHQHWTSAIFTFDEW